MFRVNWNYIYFVSFCTSMNKSSNIDFVDHFSFPNKILTVYVWFSKDIPVFKSVAFGKSNFFYKHLIFFTLNLELINCWSINRLLLHVLHCKKELIYCAILLTIAQFYKQVCPLIPLSINVLLNADINLKGTKVRWITTLCSPLIVSDSMSM
jgi:hypothetical protein